VGLMTAITGHAAGVFGGDHLREVFRFGGVLFMAAPAQIGYLGKFGYMRGRIVRVGRQGAMAGFAGDVGVFAGGAGSGFAIVAHHAGILPGERDGVLADQVERPRTVVAVLSERLGNDGASHHQEGRHRGQEYYGRPD